MKNILFLIIDAMSEAYCDIDREHSPTPFIDSLKADGIYCKNMFSQGPYTEAALTPFYTGEDNLNNSGNFFRGDEIDKTTFERMQEAGYDVLSYTQPLIYPTTMHRGINEERYGVAYFISAMWDYRLLYFQGLYYNNQITDEDYKHIYKLVDSNFEFAIESLKEYKVNSPKYDFISKYVGEYDFDRNMNILTSEYERYLKNKKDYIIELFKEGAKHKLFTTEKTDMNAKADNADLYLKIRQEYRKFFEKISKLNNQSAINNEHNFIRTAFALMKDITSPNNIKGDLKRYYYYRKLMSTRKQIDLMFKVRSNYKPEPSFMRYYEHFINWVNNRESENPFFCMMHVSDLHTPEIFFSIDETSIDVLRSELNVLNQYIDKLPKDFKGNIVYMLSMRFVDYCVERIIKDLAKYDWYKNTVILISADHGSSFRFWPIRTSIVNNLHVENYQIPFVIYNLKESPFCNDNYYSTKDMMKTILEIAGVENPLPGKNVVKNEKSEYMITEYLGGGCPDIYRKDILLAYRDKDYVIFAKQKLIDEKLDIFAIFDRKEDCFEKNNLVKNFDFASITKQIDILNERINQIKKDALGK